MRNGDVPILPSTKVGTLLDRYPELEEILISLAPPFQKLKNPVLRKGVAKVASLSQAAVVGRIPVDELVNKLRAAVGQEAIAAENAGDILTTFPIPTFLERPEWLDLTRIVESIDERGGGNPDKMPIATVLQKAARLKPKEIIELITTFVPAPGIDIMRRKGYLVWSVEEEPELIRTYFSKLDHS
jgi:hypothetical protein